MKKILMVILFYPMVLYAQKGDNEIIANNNFKCIKDSIDIKIKKAIIPSFSVAVSQKGKIIWQQSFGWADKENKIKATPLTVYSLASLSKSITATATMILIEKGLVKFNDPVDKYLGKLKIKYYRGQSSQVTISHLTNMMGGIPHQFQYFYSDENTKPITIEDQINRYAISVFPPGQAFVYSNFSPGIMEQIIRNVTHTEIVQFMKEQLFQPLKMNHAYVNKKSIPLKSVAKGYDYNGNLLSESEFYPKGGAGYYASVNDLIKYGMFHLKDRLDGMIPVLNDENIDILHKPAELPNYSKFYSNGWGVLKIENGKTSLLSNGAIDGTASSLLLLPEQDIAIACLTNSTMGNDFTDQIAFNIADVLLPGYLDELGKFIGINAPAFEDKPFEMVDSLIGTWQGKVITYNDSISVKMIFNKDGKITVQLQDQFETILNNVTVNNGLIQGQCFGNISLPETIGTPHYLELTFMIDKNEIYGSISAQSFHTKRPYFLIPSYISLKKD